MSEAWKDSNVIESGNYPKNSFKGVLKAIYPALNENLNAQELRLDFEDGKQVSVLMFNKDGQKGVFDDGDSVRVAGFKISKFVQSIERLSATEGQIITNNYPSIEHIKTQWAFLNEVPAGFRTVPDIIGCTISMIATKQEIGDDQQTSKYVDWTVGGVEGLQVKPAKPATSSKKPAGRPLAAPKTPTAPVNDALVTQIEDKILEGVSATIGGLYESFGGPGKSPYKPDQIRTALATLQAKE